MPELPEVELVRRKCRVFVERTIASVHTTPAHRLFLSPRLRLATDLPGHRFVRLDRHGKYLRFWLDDDSSLVIHLGMTGQLYSSQARSRHWQRSGGLRVDPHIHLAIGFQDEGPLLLLRDSRKFGRVLWLKPGASDPRLDRLGVDALKVSAPQLAARAQRRRLAIKLFLLDQSNLAGMGNIYADESLFRAGLHPERPCSTLTDADWQRLTRILRGVLERAIKLGGSSIRDYVQPDGTDGGYQATYQVYGRTGEPCRRCKAPIQRIVLGQRSSHYCEKCQA